MICSAEPSKTQWCTLNSPSEFQKTLTAVLCLLSVRTHNKCAFANTANTILSSAKFRTPWKCHIYLSPAFSAVLRTLCAQLSRTRSKLLILRASLCSTNFVRLHSRLRRDMRIYIYIYIYIHIYIYMHIYIYIYVFMAAGHQLPWPRKGKTKSCGGYNTWLFLDWL